MFFLSTELSLFVDWHGGHDLMDIRSSEMGQDEFPGLAFMVDLQEGYIFPDEAGHYSIYQRCNQPN
jgi:hypothetical protein